MAALEKKYRAPEWALMAQVSHTTGANAARWADAVALSLWPSRGIYLHGFEVKISRGDWLRELKTPAKADTMAMRCDYWWVVVGSGDVAKLDEIPGAWGLLELTGRGLVTRKVAVERAPRPDLDRGLVAAILRRASEAMIPRSAVAGALEDARKQGESFGKAGAQGDAVRTAAALEAMRKAVAEFEALSGVKIDTFQGGNIGRAVRKAAMFGESRLDYRLSSVENILQAVLDDVRAVRKSDDEAPGTGPALGGVPSRRAPA
jgi:hypothetical protein